MKKNVQHIAICNNYLSQNLTCVAYLLVIHNVFNGIL